MRPGASSNIDEGVERCPVAGKLEGLHGGRMGAVRCGIGRGGAVLRECRLRCNGCERAAEKGR